MAKAGFSVKQIMTPDEVLRVVIASARISTALANADTNHDNKTTVPEISVALLTQIGNVATLVQDTKKAFLAFRALNLQSRRDVIASFAAEFDLPNDVAEAQIETVLAEVNEIVSSVIRLVEKFRKKKAEVVTEDGEVEEVAA